MNLFKEFVNLPSYVTANGWIPFVVAILLSIVFSTIYVRYFWCQSDRDKCAAIIVTIGLSISLLSASLLPVDIFLVSYMKDYNGTFKEWANNSTRQAIEDSVTYTYYSLYGIMFIYTFFILPFAYFVYEEHDEDRQTSVNVFTTAFVYTLVFILIVSALLIAGAFIHYKTSPPQNSTEWEKIEFIVKEIDQSRGKDALTFVVNVLTFYGMINLIVYTSVGLAAFPLNMIKGFRSLPEEESLLSDSQATTQSRINELRSKQARKQLTSQEIAALADLEEEESLISRRSLILSAEKKSLAYKCEPFLRIVNGMIGCIGFLFSLLFVISLLISNIDKVMNSLGMQMGYVLRENLLQNPLDYVMLQTQKVFPVDYILFFAIIMFFLVCTVSGMRFLGICCLCVPMYKIRPGRTPPQGMMMLSFILMFVVLAFHILMYLVLPTYTTFGNQHYCKAGNSTCEPTLCTLNAPAEDCMMTRSAAFILSFAYKAWIFAASYFWLSWLILVVFVLSFFVNLFSSRLSRVSEAVDRDDFDDMEDHRIRI